MPGRPVGVPIMYLQQLNALLVQDLSLFFSDSELYKWRADIDLFTVHLQVGLF